ncbi:MAG: hypothetical protein ACFB16_01865 [Phormidesmis sp.]
MITSLATGAAASMGPFAPQIPTSQAAATAGAAFVPPNEQGTSREHIRHMLFGTISAIEMTIRTLHKLGYAEPNDWSRPITTGRGDEVMAILTKRIKTD